MEQNKKSTQSNARPETEHSLGVSLMITPFRLFGYALKFLIMGKVLKTKTGAEFAPKADYSRYLNARNRGLLLDGDSLRLSENESFQNLCVMARIGAGKTSKFVIPNVLDKARQHCSMVINDPKGEVFENTSEYMKRQGFNVVVIDPENLARSTCFNPLSEARNAIEQEQIAETLVRCGIASGNNGKDDFWVKGAIRFVSLFIRCLKHMERDNPGFYTLHNLYYLFQNFGTDGLNLENFMSYATVDYDNSDDQTLWNEWLGVTTGNKEGIKSMVLNAITALKSLSNQNIAKLTSQSDIELEEIRRKKTVIYFITPAQHADYYSFLISVFFRCVFNACMRKLPDKSTLPVYVFYDEFGHSTIPSFDSTVNTIRAYKVSITIILQSISQLRSRYGSNADTIKGGFNAYYTLPGADHETASFFERVIGQVHEREKYNIEDMVSHYHDYNLISASEVRVLEDDQALVVCSNRQPVKLKTVPYFKNKRLRRKSALGACEVIGTAHQAQLHTVVL